MRIPYIKPTLMIIFKLGIATLAAALIGSCASPQPSDAALIPASETDTIPATGFSLKLASIMASTGDLSTKENASGNLFALTCISKTATIDYAINVPISGRYRIEIQAEALDSSAKIWIEDYPDNPDQRTYNITGDIPIAKSQQGIAAIDGSPLAEGNHAIRLHTQGSVMIRNIEFILLRTHKASPINYTQKMEGETLELVWADEFVGSQIDTSKWIFDLGDWGWGNNELQYYTENEAKNARLEDGNLIIEAQRDSATNSWTSARLTTRGKADFTYGRIEFRAKVPTQRGNWSAGWLLGDSYVDEKSWPYCGEIDVLETVGYQIDDRTGNGKAHASVHCKAYYFKIGNQRTASVDVKGMNLDFHTYAIDWYPDSISASIDGKPYFSYANDGSEGAWPFDQPQNLILNLAMGGGWGGSEGLDPAVFSQELVVDYVRVYQRK